jgi:hypothetical protein
MNGMTTLGLKRGKKIKQALREGKVISIKPSMVRSAKRSGKQKPEDNTTQQTAPMKSKKTSNPLEQARVLFKGAGLDLPPIPEELRQNFKERDRWCYSSRPVKIWPYEFDEYVKEAESKRRSDYVLVAHAGHGVNSYAIHYYLVRGPLRLFLQLAWGGIYEDKAKTTAAVNKCFGLVSKLLEVLDKKGNSRSKSTMLIAASDFYGSRWVTLGMNQQEGQDKKPVELLKIALQSFTKT